MRLRDYALIPVTSFALTILVACDALDVVAHDITTPSVAISGITNGETIIDPRTITVTAHDTESDLAFVDIYLDGSRINDDTPTGQSYSATLTLLTGRANQGQHTIEVQATDAAQNKTTIGLAYTVFAP
jgi:hypothetical protein